jgi:vacuolar-type H+-ATPase subunit F/Vma7
MARLTVICGPSLAAGYRLAGVGAFPATPGTPLLATLQAVLADDELGLLLITDDLWTSLDERTRGTLEYLPRPIVLNIPAGVVAETAALRELLGEMLERAIGYRIELGGTPG